MFKLKEIEILKYPVSNGESPDEVTKQLHQDGYQVTGSGVENGELVLYYILSPIDKTIN